MRTEEGKQIVKGIVDSWSKIYISQVFEGQEYGNVLQYYVEFSKPEKVRPIPEGTVKVFFDITVGDAKDDYDVEFNFENESLKHRLDSTMREAKFQVSQRTYYSFFRSDFFVLGLHRAGSTASLRTSSRSSSSSIWALSSSTRETWTRRDTRSTHLSPSLTS